MSEKRCHCTHLGSEHYSLETGCCKLCNCPMFMDSTKPLGCPECGCPLNGNHE